ncbi:MAG: GGDEF domain-containing protein [Chloracidobacterium sp.]|nr:GGDEF domain-containing protein [Chloracidobacterium sp.]
MDSKIGLLIQLTGVTLIALLTICLQRSMRSLALKYWTYSWLSLSFSLLCLRSALDFEKQADSLYSLYFFGQYLFGFMLVAGCRTLYADRELKKLSELLIIPLGIISIGLPMYSKNFDEMYNIHCLVLSGFFASAFLALRHSHLRSFGWKVMNVAVILLAIDFFLFFSIFSANYFVEMPIGILRYNSIVDLVLEITLGFGMVMVILEKLVSDYKNANEKLEAAHDRLEKLVNTDPLTAAFNRHAFYGFVGKGGGNAETVSGCVGFFDIDDLKTINDQYGHTAGDQAIRAVVHAIREIIRAEDLIYRWGGDEFFVIMVGMEAEMAAIRMQRLETLLTAIKLDSAPEPISIWVSSGFCDFKGVKALEKAIDKADEEMYRRKEMRKRARQTLPSPAARFTESPSQLPA